MGVLEDLQQDRDDLKEAADDLKNKVEQLEYLVAHLLKGKTVTVTSGDYGTGRKREGEVTGFGANKLDSFLIVRIGEEDVEAPFGKVIVN